MERNLSYQKLRMELIILQCTLRAYIFDDVEKSLKRRARDENGKNTVVDNMSYSEWASKNAELGSSDPSVVSVKNISLEDLKKEAEAKEEVSLPYKDLTKEWNEITTKTTDNITMSEITVTKDGAIYYDGQVLGDGRVVKFGEEKNDDIEIAHWFKHNLWSDVKFQQRIDYPLGTKTPDLVLTSECEYIDGLTIEIKKLSSKNISAFTNKLKKTEGKQSSNILYDLTEFDFPNDIILEEVKKTYEKLEWLDLLILKTGDNLMSIFKRNK